MLMNHLAFRRDTADEQLAVQFAVQVGSPELLQMLYVMTAADLGAVGPDVWDGWKTEVVTDLYHRTMQHLAGDSPETTIDDLLDQRREAGSEAARRRGRTTLVCAQHLDALPAAYLNATAPQQAAADLRSACTTCPLSRGRAAEGEGTGASAVAQYQAETATVQFTVATSEQITPGIFHKLTGALSSHGLEIRTAQIHTLPDGLVLDRFWVHDPDFAGEPPPERLEQVRRSLVAVTDSAERTAADVSPHLADGRPSAGARARRAHPREHRQQHVRRLHDHRHLHPRPHRACSTPSPARCSSLGFRWAGRRSARFSTRSSTSST